MKSDRTPVSGEIVTTTATPGETEPRLTLSQLQGLLREAAALERAQRPIVITGPATTAHTHPAPQHLVVDLTNVSYTTSTTATLVPFRRVPESRTLAPLAFLTCGCAFIACAFGTAVTGGNPILIGATLALLTGTCVAFSRITGNGVTR